AADAARNAQRQPPQTAAADVPRPRYARRAPRRLVVELRLPRAGGVVTPRVSCVSRAQRSTKWCAADPGPLRTPSLERSRISGAPFRACALTLHRIRDTQSQPHRDTAGERRITKSWCSTADTKN